MINDMIIKRLYNSLNYRFWNLIHWHFPFHWAKHIYRQELGKTVDFSNPRDLNDKIQWLEFFTDTTLWSRLADKYRVRQYVVERMGDDDILIPLLGKWNTAEEIDFDALPDKFVIKPNNGSYDCVIVTDKYNYDLEEIRKKWTNHFTQNLDWAMQSLIISGLLLVSLQSSILRHHLH